MRAKPVSLYHYSFSSCLLKCFTLTKEGHVFLIFIVPQIHYCWVQFVYLTEAGMTYSSLQLSMT